jgi:hypothetical protein
MSFLITDDCDDNADVLWKLFSDSRDWSWPEGEGVYVTPGYLYDGVEAIVCQEDEFVCFGAESESGLTYGVGLDYAETCDDCCYRCGSYQVDLGYLTCQ